MNGDHHVLRQGRGRLFQYLATVTSGLSVLSCGLHNGWASPSLAKLLNGDSDIHLTPDQGSWVAASILLGILCGATLSGIILDKIGRKNVIILSAILFFVSWMVLAYAKSFPVLIVARVLVGIPDGLTFCSVPAYISEISEPQIRGFLVASFSVTSTTGILLMNVVGPYLSITTTALIFSAIPILLLLTFTWMPESPYYLLMKGRVEEARCSLQILRGSKDVEVELARIREAVQRQNENTGKFLDIITVRHNRKALFLMLGTRATNQLCGITAIMFYAQIVFREFSDTISPVTSTIIYFSMQVVFAGISSLIVDKVGRKPLMIISLVGVIVALWTETGFFYVRNETDLDTSSIALIPIIALIVFIIMFNIGMQTVPMVLIGEIFATNVKAFAFTLNDFCYCTLNIILSKFFQYTKDEYGLHVPFCVFASISVLGLLFIIFCVPETKGKTLEEIQEQLS